MAILSISPPVQPALAAEIPIQLADGANGPSGSHPDRLKPTYFKNMMKLLKPDETSAGPLPQPRHRTIPTQQSPIQKPNKAGTILDHLGAALAAVGKAIIPAAEAAVPIGSQVDLKVLVIATDGNENGADPTYSAITAHLDRLGVPYDTLKAAKNPNFRTGTASDSCALIAVLYVGATACAPTNHGAYYAIILSSSNLPYCPTDGSSCYYSFEWGAWTALAAYERQFGVREANLYTVPGGWRPNCFAAVDPPTCPSVTSPAIHDSLGLVRVPDPNVPTEPLARNTDEVGGIPITDALVTITGTSIFPYLNAASKLTIKNSWTYLAKPVDINVTKPLLTIPDGAADTFILAATYTYPDGRESMALTMANNQNFLHSQLLAYGILNWVTKGVYVGERRVSMAAQPDDILIANDTYDPNCPSIQELIDQHYLDPSITTGLTGYSLTRRGCTPADLAEAVTITPFPGNNLTVTNAILAWYSAKGKDPRSITYRLSGTDLQNVVNWQANLQKLPNAASVMLEFAFNGIGATAYPNDTLMPVVISQRNKFKWVSHTLNHMTLQPNAPYPNQIPAGGFTPAIAAATLRNEWAQNDKVATKTIKAANYFSDAVVMPSISGLDYYNAMSVLRPADLAIKYSVSDTSIMAQQGPRANTGWFNHTYDKKDNHLVIPRFPMSLYYNVSLPEEWLAEYNYFYGMNGIIAPNVWQLGRDIQYNELLDRESDVWLSYLVKGDRNPIMFHQANLRAFTWNGDNDPKIGLTKGPNHTLLGDLINATLTKYNKVFKVAITSPALHNIGVQLARLTDLYHNGAGLTATYQQTSSASQTITLRYTTPPATGSSTMPAITGCDPGYRPLPGPGADLNPAPCSNQGMTLNPTSKLMNPNPNPSLVVPVTGVTYGTGAQVYGGQTTSYVTVPSNVPVIITILSAW
jgi:hypothetical protein